MTRPRRGFSNLLGLLALIIFGGISVHANAFDLEQAFCADRADKVVGLRTYQRYEWTKVYAGCIKNPKPLIKRYEDHKRELPEIIKRYFERRKKQEQAEKERQELERRSERLQKLKEQERLDQIMDNAGEFFQ